MILNVLAVGDVVGDSGVEYLSRHLRGLKKLKGVHFTVVNGENASGVGILPRQAREIFDAGADVVTLGNHTWNRIQIADFLEDDQMCIRDRSRPGGEDAPAPPPKGLSSAQPRRVLLSSVHQRAHQLSVAGGVLQRQAGDELSLGVEELRVPGGLVPVALHRPAEGGEGRRVGVELQHPLGLHAFGVLGVHPLEILLHLQGDGAVGGEAHRAALQDFGHPGLLDGAAQGLLEEVQHGLALLGLLLQGGLCLLYTSRCV